MEITDQYQDSLDFALSLLSDVNYGDVRYTKHLELKVIARDDSISNIQRSSDQGLAIRVQAIPGAPLSFVSTSNLSRDNIKKSVTKARDISTLLHTHSTEETKLATVDISSTKREITHLTDDSIFDRSLTEIKDYVLTHVQTIKETPDISSASAGIAGVIQYKHILSTDGIDSRFTVDGVGYKGDATIRKRGMFQSYADRKGGTYRYKDLITELEELELATDIGNTMEALVSGKPVKAGTYDIIIDPAFAGLLAHESFGHMTEADSVVSGSSALADQVGERFASDIVTIVDDGTQDKGAWALVDDEGVPGQNTVILDQGILQQFMTDRTHAQLLGTTSTGNGRAQDYGYPPIVRMTNTCFLPGSYSQDELIEDVEMGILCKGHAGGESSNTGKFSFRSQVGYLIEHGEITDTLGQVTLNGNILEYLGKIDAIGNDWELAVDCGFGGCGKGSQRALVGLGGASIRFRDIKVAGTSTKKMPKMPKGMMK